MKLNAKRMESVIDPGALATDLADYLVGKGLPFRDAHRAVGELVRSALEANKLLTELTLEELQDTSLHFSEDALSLLNVRSSLALRNIQGGTGPAAVRAQLAEARAALAQ
jgi:argininosuccinate lyase